MSTPISSTSDMSDKLIVEELTTTEQTIPTESDITTDKQDFDYISLQDLMGLDHASDDQKAKLQEIWEYFSKDVTKEEALKKISEVRYNLDPPEIGESYIHKMWAYTNILASIDGAQKMKSAYEKKDRK